MIYRGRIRNGVVILPPEVVLADAQDVIVQLVGKPSEDDEMDALDGWPKGYFQQSAGALAGEDFERPPQGDLTSRDEW